MKGTAVIYNGNRVSASISLISVTCLGVMGALWSFKLDGVTLLVVLFVLSNVTAASLFLTYYTKFLGWLAITPSSLALTVGIIGGAIVGNEPSVSMWGVATLFIVVFGAIVLPLTHATLYPALQGTKR